MEVQKTVILLSFVTCAWYNITIRKMERVSPTKDLNASYDYIIVGAGSSGATLAARLSEDFNATVLVLEAGGEDIENPLFDIPRYSWHTIGSEADWKYITVPQKYSGFGFKNRQFQWPRGKMLGGSSQLNFMFFVRGSRHDFDEWAAEGCDGWAYDDVLPYFKRFEDMDDASYASSGFRGKGGPMKIITDTYSSLVSIFLNAGRDKGYEIGDFNGANQEVFGRAQKNVIDGLRGSTSRAFLRPAMIRPNLHVAVKAHVAKIVFEDTKAVAVEFIHDGVKKTVRSRKEIILSAGTIGSAQILMLSGFGPRKHLEKMQIPVVQDLPVGNNLDDHIHIALQFKATKPQIPVDITTNTYWEWLKYQVTGKSVAYSLPQLGVDAAAFIRVGSTWKKKYPNIVLYFGPPCDSDAGELMKALGFENEVPQKFSSLSSDLPKGTVTFGIFVSLVHAQSKGTIRLKSEDPFDYPEIDPNYFDNAQDIKTIIEGIRFAHSLVTTETFKKNGVIFDETPHPECRKTTEFDSDSYWECYIRYTALSTFHHTSTCRMGAQNDTKSVVDPQLRVKGIHGLRVADASIMPVGVSGNTNAGCIMIAEKAADMITNR